MNTDDARQFAEEMASIMKAMIEDGKEVMAMCFSRMKDKRVSLLGLPFPDDRSKDVAAMIMRLIRADPEVDYVVFLSDVWTAEIKQQPGEEVDYSLPVRKRPDRQEAVIATLFGRNRLTEFGKWKYERQSGKVIFSPKMEWMVPDSSKGRFVVGDETHGTKQ